jgi:hypothetical protein
VEGGGVCLTVSGVSRNRGGFVKCVAIQKRLGIPGLEEGYFIPIQDGTCYTHGIDKNAYQIFIKNLKGSDHLEGLGQGWRAVLRARAQILDYFRRNSFPCPWGF